MNKDTIQRFLFETIAARGEFVQVDQSVRTLLENHDYPPVLQHLLGETMAAAALLVATLKFEGSLTLQLQGDGPVSLLVIHAEQNQTMRGVARWKGTLESSDLKTLFGNGVIVITLQGKGSDRYQGVVSLDKPDLATCLEVYFDQSEQLPTLIRLFANSTQAGGIMLQVIPDSAEKSTKTEAWNTLCHLTNTLTAKEAFSQSNTSLIQRLFHAYDVRLFSADPIQYACTCSRERVGNTLHIMGKAELISLLEETGKAVEIHCDFCNKTYSFDELDIEQLFQADAKPPINQNQ